MLVRDKHSSLSDPFEKLSVNMDPVSYVIKLLFRPQFINIQRKARVFIIGKPFRPSVMFVDKAGAYLGGVLERNSPLR
jgi:hypothetical protein